MGSAAYTNLPVWTLLHTDLLMLRKCDFSGYMKTARNDHLRLDTYSYCERFWLNCCTHILSCIMGYVMGCVGHTLNHRVSSLQVGFPNLLLQIPSASQGADHYGRYDLPAFHLLVSALSLEQLRERSRFHALDDADDADLLPSPQAIHLEIWELWGEVNMEWEWEVSFVGEIWKTCFCCL